MKMTKNGTYKTGFMLNTILKWVTKHSENVISL
jgi:hypothetical protein